MAEIDPTVALRVNSSTASGDPLGTAGAIVGLQGGINQNVLFAKTMAARQKLGSIIAGAPSMEAGLAAAQSDPDVAAFVPDLLSTNEGIESTLVGREAQEQTMAQSGLKSILGTEGSALSNPGLWQDNANAAMAMVPPSVRPQVGQAFDLLGKGLMDGLSPADPRSDLKKRMAALMVGSGTTDPGTAADILGTVLPSVQTLNVGAGGAPVTGVASQGGLGESGPLTFQPGQKSDGGTPMPSSPQTGNVVDQDFAALGQKGAQPTPQPAPLEGVPNSTLTLRNAQAQNEGTTEQQINSVATGVPSMINRIETIKSALANVKLGGGAEAAQGMAEAAQALQRAGVDIGDSTINKIAGGSLGDLQVLHADIGQMLAQAASQTFSGSGSEATAHYINEQTEALSHESDPNAVIKYINNIEANLRVQGDMAQKYQDEWLPGIERGDKDKTPGNFANYYMTKMYDPKKLPTDGPVGFGGMNANINPSNVKGSAADNAAYSTGQIVKGKGGKYYKFNGGANVQANWVPVGGPNG